MNIFKAFWTYLKNLFVKEYTKEKFTKTQVIKYLDKALPKKNKFSYKDLVNKLKKFSKD